MIRAKRDIQLRESHRIFSDLANDSSLGLALGSARTVRVRIQPRSRTFLIWLRKSFVSGSHSVDSRLPLRSGVPVPRAACPSGSARRSRPFTVQRSRSFHVRLFVTLQHCSPLNVRKLYCARAFTRRHHAMFAPLVAPGERATGRHGHTVTSFAGAIHPTRNRNVVVSRRARL